MKILVQNSSQLRERIDVAHKADESIVLRYRNAIQLDSSPEKDTVYKEWLQATSIREGVRAFPLLSYRGVDVYLLDETSCMHTKTLKSIDGCVSTAICKMRGYERVVFESGGNTGTALTRYGRKAGLETFFFCPEENLPLLNSQTFQDPGAHLISVERPGHVKQAAHLFAQMNGVRHIPETSWRYRASLFRGLFVAEYLIEEHEKFDWIAQTVSAAFGPIGIYRVLEAIQEDLDGLPRFLGVQQQENCPMYRAWKSPDSRVETAKLDSTAQLLTRVMYDVEPHTYGTFDDLRNLLVATRGDLTTISRTEFDALLQRDFGKKNVVDGLKDNDVDVTRRHGEIVEKTGLIALAGTVKEIDKGTIEAGSKVLCCLTSGVSETDGLAQSEYKIQGVSPDVRDYSKKVFPQ